MTNYDVAAGVEAAKNLTSDTLDLESVRYALTRGNTRGTRDDVIEFLVVNTNLSVGQIETILDKAAEKAAAKVQAAKDKREAERVAREQQEAAEKAAEALAATVTKVRSTVVMDAYQVTMENGHALAVLANKHRSYNHARFSDRKSGWEMGRPATKQAEWALCYEHDDGDGRTRTLRAPVGSWVVFGSYDGEIPTGLTHMGDLASEDLEVVQ